MNHTILTILSLSVSGSVLALVLIALRPLLKSKVTKTFQYYIWLLVLLRLAVPLTFDDSIMNRIISHTGMTQAPVISTLSDSGTGTLMQGNHAPQGNGQNTSQEATPSQTAQNGNVIPDANLSAEPQPTHVTIWKFATDHLTAIWLLGMLVHFSWFLIAYLRFSRRIRKTNIQPHPGDMEVFVKLRGNMNVQLACNPYIDTPMLIGLSSPCIVIPPLKFAQNGMKPELWHILRHELTHYRRRDLLYKWFAVFVSSLHWFNPLMILIRREINRTCELSCDETVIRSLDAGRRNDYGETLLTIASNKRLPTGVVTTTMCEQKRELKERLESIMTFKRKNVFMVALSLILALSIAGCSLALGSANGASPSPAAMDTPGVSPSPSPNSVDKPDDEAPQSPAATVTPSVSTSPSSLEAYNAVLQNESEFYSTDNKINVYLNDFLTDNEPSFNITRFTVLDMDGDTVPEVVLELSVGGNPQFYEVLHSADGIVNGYLIIYRGLIGLKTDGTFSFSSGAADSGWGALRFEPDGYTTDLLGYSKSSQEDTELTISYFINDEQVTKESFDSSSNEQFVKEDAVWYEFSQENIETELSK